MFRRIRPPDEVTWENPIRHSDTQPVLADLLFPADPRTPGGGKAMQALNNLYSKDRRKAKKDVQRLQTYVYKPQAQFLILWGDVGIGKTFFVRYETERLRSKGPRPFFGGVIDLLRGGGEDATSASVYRQLCPLLEEYYSHFYGSTKAAVRQYADWEARQRLGPEASEQEVSDAASGLTHAATESTFDRDYALLLLSTLEYCNGEPLFIAVDNIDKALDVEQDALLKLATRLLRNLCIRLIIPLRKSSALLGDRFKGLHEFRWEEMTLSQLRLAQMLQIRFARDRDGQSIADFVIRDGANEYTYGQLYSFLYTKGEEDESAGSMLESLAGPNARVFLSMIDHALKSDQLQGLQNIGSHEHVIAALMLSDESTADPYDTYLLNLFENHEPGVYGNTLIRFRVLEYFYAVKNARPSDVHFQKHIDILGLQFEKVLHVLGLFVSRGLLISRNGILPEKLPHLDPDEIGALGITESGSCYFEFLMKSMWYFVAAKRSILLPDKYRHYDREGKYEYVTHTGLVGFLQEAEMSEKETRRKKEKKLGQLEFQFKMPSAMARTALKRDESEV